MLRANEQAFAHSTNVNLVDIRSTEIDYFCNLFSSFSTQCALTTGFCANALIQVSTLSRDLSSQPWKYIYYFSTTLSLLCAIHVMLCSSFITVYGQGLALRGPVGSLSKALYGMHIEHYHVLTVYIICIVSFGCAMIGVYFAVMEQDSAIVCTCLTASAMYFWYKYVLRIYNRFRLRSKDKVIWMHSDDYTDSGSQISRNKLLLLNSETTDADSSDSPRSLVMSPNDQQSSFFSNVFGKKINKKIDRPRLSTEVEKDPSLRQNLNVIQEGYASVLLNKKWTRVFVVLNNQLIHLYEDRKAFERDPTSMLKKTAFDIEGYRINNLVNNIDNLLIELVPDDEEDEHPPFSIKCDSSAELMMWHESFLLALQLK